MRHGDLAGADWAKADSGKAATTHLRYWSEPNGSGAVRNGANCSSASAQNVAAATHRRSIMRQYPGFSTLQRFSGLTTPPSQGFFYPVSPLFGSSERGVA